MSDPYAGIGVAADDDPYAGIGAPVQQAAPRKRTATEAVTGFMANVNRAIPLADEAAAGIQAGVNVLSGRASAAHPIQAFNNALAQQRGYEDTFDAEHPNVAALGRGLGMAGTVALPGGQAAAAPNALARVAQGTATAAGTGAAYAIADRGTAPERLKAGVEAAINPLNLAFGALGARVGVAPKAKPAKPPSLSELTTARKAAYKDVEQSGHKFNAQAFGGMVDDLRAQLAKEQFDPDFHPTVQTMLARLDAKVKQGYAPTLAELDNLRKFVSKNVAGVGDKNTRRLGGVIMRGIDGLIDSEGAAAEIVGKARDLYKRESKVSAVTEAVQKGRKAAAKSGSGANVDNAIRQKLDKVLEKTQNLTSDERAALESIVYGGPVQNTARAVGKMSPLSGGLSGMLNTLAAHATGGASLAFSVPASVAKVGADAATKTKVRNLIDLMAAGGSREQLLAAQKTAQQIDGPAGQALRKLIAARISRVGGVASGAPSASPAR
jgi:hypothetical protein